jgi:hypothetical protein
LPSGKLVYEPKARIRSGASGDEDLGDPGSSSRLAFFCRPLQERGDGVSSKYDFFLLAHGVFYFM